MTLKTKSSRVRKFAEIRWWINCCLGYGRMCSSEPRIELGTLYNRWALNGRENKHLNISLLRIFYLLFLWVEITTHSTPTEKHVWLKLYEWCIIVSDAVVCYAIGDAQMAGFVLSSYLAHVWRVRIMPHLALRIFLKIYCVEEHLFSCAICSSREEMKYYEVTNLGCKEQWSGCNLMTARQ